MRTWIEDYPIRSLLLLASLATSAPKGDTGAQPQFIFVIDCSYQFGKTQNFGENKYGLSYSTNALLMVL